MLLSTVRNPEIPVNDLYHDLDLINQWANQWKLEFNPDPIKQVAEVLFSCKESSPQIMFKVAQPLQNIVLPIHWLGNA